MKTEHVVLAGIGALAVGYLFLKNQNQVQDALSGSGGGLLGGFNLQMPAFDFAMPEFALDLGMPSISLPSFSLDFKDMLGGVTDKISSIKEDITGKIEDITGKIKDVADIPGQVKDKINEGISDIKDNVNQKINSAVISITPSSNTLAKAKGLVYASSMSGGITSLVGLSTGSVLSLGSLFGVGALTLPLFYKAGTIIGKTTEDTGLATGFVTSGIGSSITKALLKIKDTFTGLNEAGAFEQSVSAYKGVPDTMALTNAQKQAQKSVSLFPQTIALPFTMAGSQPSTPTVQNVTTQTSVSAVQRQINAVVPLMKDYGSAMTGSIARITRGGESRARLVSSAR